MGYIVAADDNVNVDIAPADEKTEILQNVRTIIGTVKYEIPLDRQFGIDGAVIDLPMPKAQAKLSQEIFQAIKRYEPRAVIESINFKGELAGKLIPVVEVSINETG